MMDVNADMEARGAVDKQSLRANGSTGLLTEEFERIQRLPPKEAYVVKSMDIKEQRLLGKLIEKYDDDYEKMARDIKINVHQKTASQLQKRVGLYKRLQDM